MKFKQHVPGFAQGTEAKSFEFKDTADLIQQLKNRFTWHTSPSFYQFSINDKCIMVELENGKQWWVVGYVDGPVELTKWMPKK